ncbi:putative neural-cadherin 2 [Procambarus clarkii]|uniref:putative neural-cadherin 2 n=1 Tax=Procambarus clarkii TaxID=6728 RepID=UPI0037449D71
MLRRVRYSWEHQLFIMDPASILQIITNSTWMVTKLVGSDPVEFQRPEYFAEVPENTTRDLLLRLSARVQSPGDSPVFVITEGNEGGHFWLHPTTGRLSLRAPLDYETKQERCGKRIGDDSCIKSSCSIGDCSKCRGAGVVLATLTAAAVVAAAAAAAASLVVVSAGGPGLKISTGVKAIKFVLEIEP